MYHLASSLKLWMSSSIGFSNILYTLSRSPSIMSHRSRKCVAKSSCCVRHNTIQYNVFPYRRRNLPQEAKQRHRNTNCWSNNVQTKQNDVSDVSECKCREYPNIYRQVMWEYSSRIRIRTHLSSNILQLSTTAPLRLFQPEGCNTRLRLKLTSLTASQNDSKVFKNWFLLSQRVIHAVNSIYHLRSYLKLGFAVL